jgi:hypothetical protein
LGDNGTVTVCTVAFLDVLGFRDLVSNVPHEQLVGIYQTLTDAVYVETTLSVYPDDHRKWDEEPVYLPREVQAVRDLKLGLMSDSIVLYADANWSGVLSVYAAVNRLLRAGFRMGVPLRGAIALGHLDVVDGRDLARNATQSAKAVGLVGEGLVRAYLLEGRFAWSGAVFDAGLVEQLDNEVLSTFDGGTKFTGWDCIRSSPLISWAEAPRKKTADGVETSVPESRWVVNWPLAIEDGSCALTEDLVAGAFARHHQEQLDDRALLKRANTLDFWGFANWHKGEEHLKRNLAAPTRARGNRDPAS